MAKTMTRPAGTQQSLREKMAAVQPAAELTEAIEALSALQAEEQRLLGVLQETPDPEDPHLHDQTRARLQGVRERIAVAARRVQELRAKHTRAVAEAVFQDYQDTAGEFLRAIERLHEATAAMDQFRRVAGGVAQSDNRFRFDGLEHVQSLLPKLRHVQQLWAGR